MMESRELFYRDQKSDKFWRIELKGSSHTVTYGRAGTAGQQKTKDFESESKARTSFEKLIASKIKKGYSDDPKIEHDPEQATTNPSSSGTKTDLADGESVEMKGSAAKPYVLRNVGGVFSCSCPAWRNQSIPIEQRTCKHLRKLRGDEAEKDRVGNLRPLAKAKDANAPGLLLAHSWDGEEDLTGWWLSEKLDGVRAYWNGEYFESRAGNRFYAPDWFLNSMPTEPLDGELFGGRKKFQETVSIVRRQDKSDLWRKLTFKVFDAPKVAGPFEERLQFCKGLIEELAFPNMQLLEHRQCESVEDLKEELERIESLSGEGLMARAPASNYEVGRSFSLLKIKTFQDADAVVIAHQAGSGKHKGRLGSLLVELPDGTRFSVGTGFTDAQRESPPVVGATIVFRYQELSRDGVPRFPSFVGERAD